MEGNVVSAARWLGTFVVIASVFLVGGVRWVVSIEMNRVSRSIHADLEALSARLDAQRPPSLEPAAVEPATHAEIDRIMKDHEADIRLLKQVQQEQERTSDVFKVPSAETDPGASASLRR